MARIIVSIPFWILAVLFFAGGMAWLVDNKATNHEIARRFALAMIASGVWGVLAVLVMG
jgi:hypothetical protein